MPASHRAPSRIRSLRWHIARAAEGLATRCLVCCVTLSLWHAPIPWLHAHDLRGPSVEHSELLHRHVDEFHLDELDRGEEHLALHSHLLLPWKPDPHDSRPGSDSGGPCSDEMLLGLTLGASDGGLQKGLSPSSDRAFGIGLLHAVPVLNGLPHGGAPQFGLRHGRHFFETFGRAVSITDLLGVRLC